jgi:hypothetical protein
MSKRNVKKARKPIRRLKNLNQRAGDDEEEDDTEAQPEEDDEEEEPVKTKKKPKKQQVPSLGGGSPPPSFIYNNSALNNSFYQQYYQYYYLWTITSVRDAQIFIGIGSIGLLLATFAIFWLWILRLIPSIPPTFFNYGVIWYVVFVFTGVLTLAVSCTRNKVIITITFFLSFLSLLISYFLVAAVSYQIAGCVLGYLDPSCASFYLTNFLVLFLTIAIAIATTIITIFLAVLVNRINRAYSLLGTCVMSS